LSSAPSLSSSELFCLSPLPAALIFNVRLPFPGCFPPFLCFPGVCVDSFSPSRFFFVLIPFFLLLPSLSPFWLVVFSSSFFFPFFCSVADAISLRFLCLDWGVLREYCYFCLCCHQAVPVPRLLSFKRFMLNRALWIWVKWRFRGRPFPFFS